MKEFLEKSIKIENYSQGGGIDLEDLAQKGVITPFTYETVSKSPFYIEIINEIARFDEITFRHTLGVARYVETISNKLGLDKKHVENLVLAALIHDFGKKDDDIARVVKLDRKLNKEELEVMRKHSRATFDKMVDLGIVEPAKIAISHHEDQYREGSVISHSDSYPRGTSDELYFGIERRKSVSGALKLARRILSIADVFNALVSKRQYKEVWPLSLVEEEMRNKFKREKDQEIIGILIDYYKKDISEIKQNETN